MTPLNSISTATRVSSGTRLVSLLRQSELLATIVCGLRGTLRKLADFASMLLREFLSSTQLDHLFAKSIFEGHRL